MKPIRVTDGLLYFLVKSRRPELADKIRKNGVIETMIVGLGRQGMRHAYLMQEYGTNITCGVAPGKGNSRVYETIPVYNTADEAITRHPNIAVASIWRHYSTARDATIDVIRAGIPIVVLISEFIPQKDVRDILTEARKHNTLLIGGNTPGIIFPPESTKIGMLPDIFYPQEVESGQAGPKGVTIISRSGAILYHLSDALAGAGIAQNGVLGIGGDGAIGTRLVDLVPLVMQYEHTDLVVIAGEIGGVQEELLAQDIIHSPEKYQKPLVALISGSNAPEGKTMGHAGAVISPGEEFGTYQSKKQLLERADVTVVNHQPDLIQAVKQILGEMEYFDPTIYFEKMRAKWEEKPPEYLWGTSITQVLPNNLVIRGYRLPDLIRERDLLEVTSLLIEGKFPTETTKKEIEQIAIKAVIDPLTVDINEYSANTEFSRLIGTLILTDDGIKQYFRDKIAPLNKVAYALGRVAKYISIIFEHPFDSEFELSDLSFSQLIYYAFTGDSSLDPVRTRLIEAMIVACVDHGVTPPSAQATVILASTRASLEAALAAGIFAITDVHGGAGAKAADFFLKVVKLAKTDKIEIEDAAFIVMKDIIQQGSKIEGLGHRIHTHDPRRDILWKLAEEADLAEDCVGVSRMVSDVFYRVRGMQLPINVDGVIGAITADMGLDPVISKAVFVYGRIVGLASHYYEELITQQPMRRIEFQKAVYRGKASD